MAVLEKDIATKLPKHLFWDMDISKLSIKQDKAIIIPRLLLATNERTFKDDILLVEALYNVNDIYTILKTTKERISNQLCKMVAKRYNKPPFLRYKF
ncbi:hypothetical protein MHTCC0001_30600 [Flavobacteriaceae bacterium MHTCC 0001]